MRVTQSMMSANMMRNLNQSYERLARLQEQAYTEKRILRPSDDPVVAMKGIGYRTNLAEVEQYKRNYREAHNWIENADTALDKVTNALHKIRELVTQGANDPVGDDPRGYIADEIEQIKKHLENLANTKVGDQYIFNGTNSLKKPVDLDKGDYPDQEKMVKFELAKGVFIEVSVDTYPIFNEDDGIFKDIDGLINELQISGASGEKIGEFITKIEQQTDKVLSITATLGALTNRIELMETRIDEEESIAKRMMVDNEHVDMEKILIDLISQESVHRAALGVGGRIIQPTLLDFLR